MTHHPDDLEHISKEDIVAAIDSIQDSLDAAESEHELALSRLNQVNLAVAAAQNKLTDLRERFEP